MAKNGDEQVFSRVFSGMTTCLGHWCGHKEFWSPDKTKYRYCKKCAAKKEQAARGLPGIKICSAQFG